MSTTVIVQCDGRDGKAQCPVVFLERAVEIGAVLTVAERAGWRVDENGDFCPGHAKWMVRTAERRSL